ncbi:hypothetical protein [Nonomuraea sp. NPDC050691]|uniref:hypothetical protein n=1 Tax=Nonomuraea sp. NPDC050691 TaxID=3155661 RepID=UPI0033DFC0E7
MLPTRGNGHGGHHDLQEPAGVEHGAGEDGVGAVREARQPGRRLLGVEVGEGVAELVLLSVADGGDER